MKASKIKHQSKAKSGKTAAGKGNSTSKAGTSKSGTAKSKSDKKDLQSNGKPARKNDQPKKIKLRDQKTIPVPQSAFDVEDEEEEEDDLEHGMMIDSDTEEDDEEEEEEEDEEGKGEDDADEEDMEAGPSKKRKRADESGMGYLKSGNAGFLTTLDAKDISRTKKETQRLHELAKSRNPLPKPKKGKRSRSSSISTVSSFSDVDIGSDDLGSDLEGDGEVDEEGYSSDDLDSDDDMEDEEDEGMADDVEDSDDSEDSEIDQNERQRARKKSRAADQTVDNLESSYESRHIQAVKSAKGKSKATADAEAGIQEVSHLPIKLANGEIQRLPGTTRIQLPPSAREPSPTPELSDDESGTDSDDVSESEQVDKLSNQRGKFGRMSVLDVVTYDDPALKDAKGKGVAKARTMGRLAVAKEQIAKTGAEIMAGGELIDNVPLLTRLSTFALPRVRAVEDGQPPIDVPNSIRGLAFLSQLAVYKDLIPGYRIRELTEIEQAEKVRDEVRRLREGEKGLIKSYKQYLKMLEAEIKQRSPLSSVALKCMCELLTAAPHFNFAENVMGVIVGRLSKRSWDENSEMCLQTIITVFRNDVTSKYSAVLLRLVARMIKERHYRVHPNVLACLLHLRLRSELGAMREKGKGRGAPRDPTAKREEVKVKSEVRKTWMTKNRRKAQKEKKEVEKEMDEAEAEVDMEERATVQTETLKNLFVLYFSIIKQPHPGPLLPAALEGISKFAHLVNIEFFRDLLLVLKRIVMGDVEEDDDEDVALDIVGNGAEVRLRLLAIVTAFDLLSGQGEALNIDLNDFFVQLYGLLLPLSLDTAIEQVPISRSDALNPGRVSNGPAKPLPKRNVQLACTADLLFRCLNLIFFSRHASTANSPPWRAAAFAKRLLECSLQFPSATAIKSIEFAKRLVIKEPKLEALLSTEDRTVDGVYRPEMNDPQLSNPFGASFWELTMLTRDHWDENVRAEAEKLARGKLV